MRTFRELIEAKKVDDDVYSDAIRGDNGIIEIERTGDWGIVWILDIRVKKDKRGQGVVTSMLEKLFKKVGEGHGEFKVIHPGSFVCDSATAESLLRVLRRFATKHGVEIGDFYFDPQD